MAYTFQSRATADLIMLKATAEQLLKLLDKQVGEPGIVTVEQIPHALDVLERAVAEDDAKRKAIEIDPQYGDAHFNLAVIYATQKPPAKELARRHYKLAQDLGIPKDPQLEKLLQ